MSSVADKHPPIIWYLAIVSALMSIPFGVINSLLVLYLQQVMHVDPHAQYALFSAYNALLFILPLVGGFTAGRFGYKKALIFATFLCVSGTLVLTIPTMRSMTWGLSLFATGISMYVPTYLVLVGKIYTREDARRESGYTLVYVISNMGFLLSAFLGGYIQRYFSFGAAFVTGGLFMALLFFSFPWMLHRIKCVNGNPIPALSKSPEWRKAFWIVLIMSMMLPICDWLLNHAQLSNNLLLGLVVIEIIGVLIMAFFQPTRRDRLRLLAFLILSVTSMGFWALYILEPSLLTMFIQSNVNRNLGGLDIPPSVFYGLDPFFIILLGSLFSVLWIKLHRARKDPSLPTKFTLSLLAMAIGMAIFAFSIVATGFDVKVSLWWVVLGYFFLTTGELLISPIGQAMVGKLVPVGQEGLMMGVWQTFVGMSAAVADYFAETASVPEKSTYVQSSHIYFKTFVVITVVTLILTGISWLIAPFVKKAIGQSHSAHEQDHMECPSV